MERTCALLIGDSLGNMLSGNAPILEETFCRHWLNSGLFSGGIENESIDLQTVIEMAYSASINLQDSLLISLDNVSLTVQKYLKLAFKLPSQYGEACAVGGATGLIQNDLYEGLLHSYQLDLWDNDGDIIDTVVHCFLVTLLKQTGLIKTSSHPAFKEIYRCTFKLRQKLISSMCCKFDNNDDSGTLDGEKEHENAGNTNPLAGFQDDETGDEEQKFVVTCQKIIQRCLFLLIYVKGGYCHLKLSFIITVLTQTV